MMDMIQQYIDKKQYICFSIDELFKWQDRLDEIEKEQAWELFNNFLDEAENVLEYSEEFIRELERIHEKITKGDLSDFVKYEFKFCHNCDNCISDDSENLTCSLDNEHKNFDDSCDNWKQDIEMIE